MCPEPLCCREENASVTQGLAGHWGFLGKCDLPLRTLDHFVKTVVEDIKPDMIVWTGDNPPHNPWVSDEKQILDVTNTFIDLLLNKYKYDKPVFPSIGNHEEYIVDQYSPYDSNREKQFLLNFGNMYRPWLDDAAYKSYTEKGYYTLKYPNSDLRVI